MEESAVGMSYFAHVRVNVLRGRHVCACVSSLKLPLFWKEGCPCLTQREAIEIIACVLISYEFDRVGCVCVVCVD